LASGARYIHTWKSAKTSSFQLPYQRHNSSANYAREQIKPAKELSSLLVCNEKKIFGWGLWIFINDAISAIVFENLGSCYLTCMFTSVVANDPTARPKDFAEVFIGN